MKLAAVQLDTIAREVGHNVHKAMLWGRQAFEQGAKFVFFHEGLTADYSPEPMRDGRSLDSIEVYGQDESVAEEGESLVLLAQAYDIDGAPVFGVAYSWDVSGTAYEEQGDLYRYEYDENEPEVVGANFGELRAEVSVHVGEGYVDSSNNVGCDSSGVGVGFGSAIASLLAAVSRKRKS